MNDHELDRLVASATHVRDSWVDGFDLRAAEDELMEEIMATTNETPVPLASGPPPSGAPSPFAGRPRRFKLAVAVGVAATLLVGLVVARSVTGGDEGKEGDVGTGPAQAPMIAGSLPDGIDVDFVEPEEGDPAPPPRNGPVDTWVYGDVTATAISNDVVISVASAVPEGEVLGDRVNVRGKDGILCSPGPKQCDFGNNITGVSWQEAPGKYVSVESRTFDRDQVMAIAENLRIEGDDIALGDVPAGVSKPPKAAELQGAQAHRTLYLVRYASSDGSRSFVVSTTAEDETTRIYNLWSSGPRDGGQVQGKDASFEDIDGEYFLIWEAAPGRLVEVQATGVDEATARAFAESVRPASEEEWTDLKQRAAENVSSSRDTSMEPPDDAVHRELASGAQVWGWSNDEGLCYRTLNGDGYAADSKHCSSNGATQVLGVSPTNLDGELRWDVPAAVGVAPDGTESIDGGEVTFGEQVEGGRLFIWEFSEGEMPDSLTFRDAEGEEIATSPVVVI